MAVTSVNDYSKRLAENRSRYNESAEELRNTYRQHLKDKEDLHAKTQDNQRKTYLRQKDGLERTHRQNLDHYSDRLRETLDDQKQRYRDGLTTRKKAYEEGRKELIENYNKKLEGLTQSLEESRRQDQMSLEQQRERLRNLESRVKRDTSERYNREKGELLHSVQDERAKLKDRHRQDLDQMRENRDNQVAEQKKITQEMRQELLKNNRTDLRRQRNNFEDTIQGFANRSQERLERISDLKESEKEQLKDLLKDKNDSLASKMKSLNHQRDAQNWANLQKEILWENRVKGLVGEMKDQTRRYQANSDRMASDQTEALREIEKNYRQATEKLKRDMSKVHQRKVASLQKKFDLRDRNRIRQQRYLQSEYENKEIADKRKNKHLVERLKGDYERKFNSMQDFHLGNMEDYKRELSEERGQVIEETKARSIEENAKLREELKTNYSDRENALYRKIENNKIGHQIELNRSEDKLDRFKDKAIEEIEQARMIEHARRQEDKKKADYERKLANEANKQEKLELHNQMEKRLAKYSATADVQVNKLIKKYENLLRKERLAYQKELNHQASLGQFEKERLFKFAETQKNQLIRQYENKIDELKKVYKKRLAVKG